MKTAMQELFSQLEIEHPAFLNTNTLEGRQRVNDYYKFIEMEKEQIINSYQDGYNNSYFKIPITKREYYEDTFKKQ